MRETFGYTGKSLDNIVGQYDYGYRHYDPLAGRFTTLDPIQDGDNWYAYCGNDGINLRDPFGLCGTDSQDAKNINLDYFKLTAEDLKPVYSSDGLLLGVGVDAEQRKAQLDSMNYAEQFGDAASAGAFGLNVANFGAAITGNFAAAETFGTGAGIMDFCALIAYSIAGDSTKASYSAISVGLDLVPMLAPSVKAAYNPKAARFINAVSKRFISDSVGKTKYIAPPLINITMTGVSKFATNEGSN